MERVPEELQQEVQALVSASDELLILLNNVINLAKLEDDEQTEVKQEVFDLQILINKLIVLFGPVAKQRGLILEADYAEDIPKKFISDSLLVQRSILNLVSNALKFTEQGHVIVRVQKDESALNPDEQIFPLQIIVEDTGIGIAPEAQTEIFEKFYRAWPSFQGKYRGSGLGLSIVARFVSKLGGNVEVRSVLGKGSCFMINLPLKIADDTPWIMVKNPDDYASDHAVAIQNQVTPNQLKIKQVFPEGVSISRQPRILLVEDNSLIQKGVTHTLNKLNCFVEIAATGTQGLEMAAARQYDLIFMDIGLPDHDGLWVSRQIRQLPYPQGQTPIIALTAHIDLKYEEVCTEAGMDKIIVKPLSLEEAQRCLDLFVLNRKIPSLPQNPSLKPRRVIPAQAGIHFGSTSDYCRKNMNQLKCDMRIPLIAGNWKMNGSKASIKALLQALLQNRERFKAVELAVFPPFVYLELVSQYLQGSPVAWGAQNVSSAESGAFTGEISAAMLRDFQCHYVIVGHSERRILYGETDQQVGAKFAAALKAGLRPILCVGETAEERQAGATLQVIERQLAVALKLADNLPDLSAAVIAYEPVWAIGTGQMRHPGRRRKCTTPLGFSLTSTLPVWAQAVRIIYGGSVKSGNAAALFAEADIDGALVGGASLQVNEFIEIAEQCKR